MRTVGIHVEPSPGYLVSSHLTRCEAKSLLPTVLVSGNQLLHERKVQNRHFRFEESEQSGDVLHIEQLSLADSGLYTCVVNNTHTAHEQSVIVLVTGKQIHLPGHYGLVVFG